MLTTYTGYLYYSDHKEDVTEEVAVSITANTKEEALGIALEAYPLSHKSDWEIVGGFTDSQTIGIIDTHIHNKSSYWG